LRCGRGADRSHMPDRSVVLTGLPRDREFVRVFRSAAENPEMVKRDAVGEWIMPRSEIVGPDGRLLSPEAIRERFSLPEVPTHVVDVEPGRPVRAWVSRAAGRSPEAGGFEGHWGRGGGEQWRMEVDLRSLEVREEVETWMKNPRRLKGSGE